MYEGELSTPGTPASSLLNRELNDEIFEESMTGEDHHSKKKSNFKM
jgi:hypothetical protein